MSEAKFGSDKEGMMISREEVEVASLITEALHCLCYHEEEVKAERKQ